MEILEDSKKNLSFSDAIGLLWGTRKSFIKVLGLTILICALLALLLPKKYRSTATLLPENNASDIARLAGLSGIASLAGINLGGTSLEQLYPSITKSEAVLRSVIYEKYRSDLFTDPVNLIEFWKISEGSELENFEEVMNKLTDVLQVSLDIKTNILTVSISTRDAKTSAAIVNKVITELDGFLRKKQTTHAIEQRKWIETRLVEVEGDLKKSEEDLKKFRERNRRLNDSPELMLVQARLMRTVAINETLYTELRKQFELVKIDEVKAIPIINRLDEARPAAEKDSPKMAILAAGSVLVLFVCWVFGTLTINVYKKEIHEIARLVSGPKKKE